MFPSWLHALSIASLALGFVCAAVAVVDLRRHPPHMAIMGAVWPATALFAGPAVLWLYFRYGRMNAHEAMAHAKHGGAKPHAGSATPFPVKVAKGALHCGSGCVLGDIIAEWLVFLAPAVAVWFGWHSLFDDKMYAAWLLDYVLAFLFGIAFQYFTITPMRDLSPSEGLVASLKADTLSLTAWQVGMYGFMAFAQFYLFGRLLGHRAEADTPEFWFVMQIAMVCGFATSYPVNWWLVRAGVKEAM
ncbi:DUF4396 domain-containing protein [Lichenibacterium minor]|uniref:DUF4396 domain-containing protein n=1 Tax=Lichenibacterium minor TaxID=2316528 RepID=A0A4Q2U8P1_9HYPH|nr:DUF4396 domain-containing protein [Lichenibacterium minor]RYC31346.1 DUF4396 domain-containing protein [Lichenibacterium minor]